MGGPPPTTPPNDMALEKRDEMDEWPPGLTEGWGVEAMDPPTLGAMSCSIRRRMGSVLKSDVLCIQVPVLISNSCFLRHKMQTHIN